MAPHAEVFGVPSTSLKTRRMALRMWSSGLSPNTNLPPWTVGHYLRHLESLGSGAISPSSRLKCQIVGMPQPVEVVIEPPRNGGSTHGDVLRADDQEEPRSSLPERCQRITSSVTARKRRFGQSAHLILGFSQTPRTYSFAQAGW